MVDLKIKKESLPYRCEICHQTDYFDPVTNNCIRCQGSIKDSLIAKPQPHTNIRNPVISNSNRLKLLSTFSFTGLISGVIFNLLVDQGDYEKFWYYNLNDLYYPSWKFYFFAGVFFQIAF